MIQIRRGQSRIGSSDPGALESGRKCRPVPAVTKRSGAEVCVVAVAAYSHLGATSRRRGGSGHGRAASCRRDWRTCRASLDARLRVRPRGSDGGLPQELAAGVARVPQRVTAERTLRILDLRVPRRPEAAAALPQAEPAEFQSAQLAALLSCWKSAAAPPPTIEPAAARSAALVVGCTASIFMGDLPLSRAKSSDRITLIGDSELIRTMAAGSV
jgi:hypothetical protein